MISVAAYTQGVNIPSRRFRLAQLISPLQRYDIEVSEIICKLGSFPPQAQLLRPFWGMGVLAERAWDIIAAPVADVSFVQREFLSTLPTLERFLPKPIIVDVDDAIWLHRRGCAARSLAKIAEVVICGNSHIAEYFAPLAKRVVVLPTAVDTCRFSPGSITSSDPVIVWSGSSGGLKFLEPIQAALARVMALDRRCILRIVSDKAPRLPLLNQEQIEFIRWSPETEVAALQDAWVGIMPLEDSDWARGKCAYKMLLYMACGLPVVVSPVGMNAEVLAMGSCSKSAFSAGEWESALAGYLFDAASRKADGASGRSIVESSFSVDHVACQLAEVIASVC